MRATILKFQIVHLIIKNNYMNKKVLCDRCKREFEADENDLTTYDGRPVVEIICPNCKEDAVLDYLDN